MLKLYEYWRSSCSFRVRWALIHKNIPYESTWINLLEGKHQSLEYLKINPQGLVPAIEIKPGELSYGESMAILEWIEETYPNPSLLPCSPLDRLYVRQIAHTIASGIQPLQGPRVTKMVSLDAEEQQKWIQHWIKLGLGSIETFLHRHQKSGTYCLGHELTLADITLGPQLYSAVRFHVRLRDFPIIEGILGNYQKLDDYQRSLPEQWVNFQ